MSNPTFQHRHYKVIAGLLADAREYELEIVGSPDMAQHARVEILLDRLEARTISILRRDNPNFSEDRFRKAARRAPDMHGKDKVAA